MDNQNYETKVGRLIREHVNVEWMRYNMYKKSDMYANIPLLVFRICEGEEKKIENLKQCISDYEGKNKWKLFINPLTRKNNYILSLDIMEKMYSDYSEGVLVELNPKDLLGEKEYIKLCETAIQELPQLITYLEKYFLDKSD